MSTPPKDMVIAEVKALLHRWEEESDLEDTDLLECIDVAISEYFEEDVVDFDSDINLDDDE